MNAYAEKRNRLLEYLVSLVRDPLALFIIRADGWAPDFLVAAVEHPQSQGVYLVLGISERFPCWDESIVEVPDWDALLREMETWLAQMQALSGSVQFPEPPVSGPQAKPVFEDKENQPMWLYWQPVNFGFSFPGPGPRNFAIHHPPAPLAPLKLVEWFDRQGAIGEVLRFIRDLEKEEERAAEFAQKAQEKLVQARQRLTEHRAELAELQRLDQLA